MPRPPFIANRNIHQLFQPRTFCSFRSFSSTYSIMSIESSIRSKLTEALQPQELEITNDSHLHAGHAAMRGNKSGETHFTVNIVSKKFEGQRTVSRHRLIYSALGDELKGGLHALVLKTKTPQEAGITEGQSTTTQA